MVSTKRIIGVGVVGAGLFALTLPASAGSPERPATWDMSQAELEAVGLGQSRGEPVPFDLSADAPVQRAGETIIFLNFDGAQLVAGQDDSRSNRTFLSQFAGDYPAYGDDGAIRQSTIQAVKKDFEAYNFLVVDDRPASGDYAMAMIGDPGGLGGVLGVAPLDCFDSWPNNVVYAFHSANDQFPASIQATTIAQELAHSYGLEHVDEPGDIMNPFNAGGDPLFNDQCIQIVSNQGIACGQQHAAHCGGSQQNAHQELLDIFGPSAPDTAEPLVSVTSPMDGQQFESGASFEIQADAEDDRGVTNVTLFVNGEMVDSDPEAPYEWAANSTPDGEYEIFVTAVDAAGNEGTSNVVSVVVGDPPASDDDGGGTGGGSGEGDSAGADGGGGDDDKGCGCRTERGAPLSLWALGLLGLAVMRRRRP